MVLMQNAVVKLAMDECVELALEAVGRDDSERALKTWLNNS